MRDAFDALKPEVKNLDVVAIDEEAPFQIETDAFDYALAGTLNLNNRSVPFCSRSLTNAELNYFAAEKEAAAKLEWFGNESLIQLATRDLPSLQINDQLLRCSILSTKAKYKALKFSDGGLNFALQF